MNLNIQIESVEFSNRLIQSNDTFRIVITTFPDEKNLAITINAKKIEESHPFFTVGISKSTKKIIMVISKKNNIIASSIIRSEEFLNKFDDRHNIEMKNITFYEPFPKKNKEYSLLQNRKILGKMEVQFALSEMLQSKNNTIKKYI